MKYFRLLLSGPAWAAENMALDEKIFKRYLKDGVGVLRLYRWQGPAFTYGFSQNPQSQIDLQACAADGVQLAKRMTGGGILFHHDEITYSFVCSKTDVHEPAGIFVGYREICAFLIRFYKSLGLQPVFAWEANDFKNQSLAHPLCSAAYEKYDILINGKKIGGNAQKRNRQAIFQHGSLPCSIDWNFVRKYINLFPAQIPAKITTLAQELGIVPDKSYLEKKLIEAFSSTFGVEFIPQEQQVYETSLA